MDDYENLGERNRTLYIAKSRGMEHSQQIREFRLTDKGIRLIDVYLSPGGILTGSARAARQVQDEAEELVRGQKLAHLGRELERAQALFQAEMAALQARFEYNRDEIQLAMNQEENHAATLKREREYLATIRKADAPPSPGKKTRREYSG